MGLALPYPFVFVGSNEPRLHNPGILDVLDVDLDAVIFDLFTLLDEASRAVENESGEKISARLITPEGYRLTAITSLHIAQKVRMGKFEPGYQTPASAYGEDLILEIENTKRVLPTS